MIRFWNEKRIFLPKTIKIKSNDFFPSKNVSLDTLIDILKEVLSRMPEETQEEKTLEPKISLEEKLQNIRQMVAERKEVSFRKIISSAEVRLKSS